MPSSGADWPAGTLLYRDTPLAQVALEVGRHFGLPVVVEGEELQVTRITAQYGAESFQEVVESLCAVTAAACTIDEGGAVIR